MLTMKGFSRAASAALLVGTIAGCSSLGGLGNVLGSVLGGGGGSQVTGTVLSVDTRSQYVTLQDQNGQAVSLAYDNNTRVTYNNQNYNVTSLERGDRVTANVQQSNNNNSYYTDLIQVNSSVNGSVNGGSANVQAFDGTVRSVDMQNGWFTMDTNNGRYTVSMPYNPRTQDVNTFRSLRNGQYVRLYGVYLNNGRVELRQFY